MRSGRRTWTIALAIVLSTASAGIAQADETSPANVAAARKHYEKARTDYAQGAYREAIAELESAHTLDPNAKDLVFNLGVVHEKLVDIDEALKWFRLYTSMNLTTQERERADAYVRRLEGAKREVEAKQAAEPTATPPSEPPAPGQPATTSPPMGRIDTYTLTGAGVTAAALVFGIAFAIKAEVDKPPSNYVTGESGSFTQLQGEVDQAHQDAVLADVGFGAALAAAAVTAYLYLGRPRVTAAPTAGSTSVSAAPMTGGAGLFVQGSF
jgi:tetratricopeptide (TPR) repeat protein